MWIYSSNTWIAGIWFLWLFSSKTLDAIPDLYDEINVVSVDTVP